MIGRICGKRLKSMSSPSPTSAISSPKPRITPARWGSVRPNPYFTPDVINIRLFGPGVTPATKAKVASAQNISGWTFSAGLRRKCAPRSESSHVLVAGLVLARWAAPASPRPAANVEGRLRECVKRARQRAHPVEACDRPLAARQDAVQLRHGLRQSRFVIFEPNVEDARPGERQALELYGAGRAFRFDPGRLEHEAHRVHRHLIHRQRRGGLATEPRGDFAQAFAIGGHRFQTAHQDVEQSLARIFFRKLPIVLRENDAIDVACETGEYGPLGREGVPEVG